MTKTEKEPDFYRAVTEALEEAKSTPPSREYVQSLINLTTKMSTHEVMADKLVGTLQALLELIEIKDNPTTDDVVWAKIRDGMITDSKVPDEGIKRIFAGSCELVDYPAVEKITIQNGYGDPILLTYESTKEILAVLNRWRDMQIWKNRNAKSEV